MTHKPSGEVEPKGQTLGCGIPPSRLFWGSWVSVSHMDTPGAHRHACLIDDYKKAGHFVNRCKIGDLLFSKLATLENEVRRS